MEEQCVRLPFQSLPYPSIVYSLVSHSDSSLTDLTHTSGNQKEHTLKTKAEGRGPQGVVLEPGAPASPGTMLEILLIEPHPIMNQNV